MQLSNDIASVGAPCATQSPTQEQSAISAPSVPVIKVGTIRQIHRRLVEEGYHISEYALRQWVRSGQVPAVHSGITAYINYDMVIALLTGEPQLTA